MKKKQIYGNIIKKSTPTKLGTHGKICMLNKERWTSCYNSWVGRFTSPIPNYNDQMEEDYQICHEDKVFLTYMNGPTCKSKWEVISEDFKK